MSLSNTPDTMFGLSGSGRAKAQSAMEYLITYGWALIIISLFIGFVFIYVDTQKSFAAVQCTFSYGVHCNGMTVYTNTAMSNLTINLNNAQQYVLLTPTFNISVDQYGNFSGTCKYTGTGIVEGNYLTCNAFITPHAPAGAAVMGRLFVNATVCVSGNPSSCQPAQKQRYVGNFSAQVGSKTYA